ncbi:MAG: hypothetical protein MUF01_01135 [Bryobacterales bacterium]|nr:hypothetical protein [Bryobacterales bacterium]
MNLPRRGFLMGAAGMGLVYQQGSGQHASVAKRRSESFFGMHFDLHPSPNDPALGKDLRKAQVLHFLDRVQPDYVQYDCKGHAGWLGYPSQVGPSAPHIVEDSLAIWREATRERGVALFVHFSGVWDDQAVARHPEWAAVGRDGQRDPQKTSTWSSYVDDLMLPQLREVAAKYALDGAWVDGECWAVTPDWGEAARAEFVKRHGDARVPEYPTDPGWQEWLELHRERFRQYVRHYVETIHAARPGFQVTSNWLYSTMVPEKPTLPVDFLSGDYLGDAPIAAARLEARYLAQNGMSWDLMAWGFQSSRSHPTGPVHKPAVQLEQEAAVVLSQGGGFQIYYQPSREGHLDDTFIEVMGKVGDFCRARQPFCWKTQATPQVALLYSGHHLYRTSNRLFGGWGDRDLCAKGWLDALLENHYSVDVLPDWKLKEEGERFPLLVVPEWAEIGAEAAAQIRALAAKGVRLLIAGAANARHFAALAGVGLEGEAGDSGPCYVRGGEGIAAARGLWQGVEALTGTTIVDYRFPRFDTSKDGAVAATVRDLTGGGRVALVPGAVGEAFGATHAPALRQFLGGLVARVFRPQVELDAPPTVELALRRRQDALQVHLLNTTGMQVASRYAAIDYVPTIPHLRVRLRTARRPSRVMLQPGAGNLPCTYTDGVAQVQVQGLHLYQIVEFEGVGTP